MIDLEQHAAAIPTMGGYTLRSYLREAAAKVKAGHGIVEVGAWLGSGTAQMCLGVRDSGNMTPIHCFDWWTASGSEIQKAAAAGTTLKKHEDLLPRIKMNLAPFGCDIHFNKGDIRKAKWNGWPIGLYVDDAAKRQDKFLHVMQVFCPSFIPGETVIILMDYYYYEHRLGDAGLMFQKQYMESHQEFQFIQRLENSVAAQFVFKGKR